MIINYKRLSRKPIIFSMLVGMNVEDFDLILEKLKPLWKKNVLESYKRPGRNFKMEFPDILIMTIIYYRNYVTHEFLGYLFGIDSSNVGRLIKKIEPLIFYIDIRKDRHLSQKEVEKMIKEAPY